MSVSCVCVYYTFMCLCELSVNLSRMTARNGIQLGQK